eukprot:765308-Hanusia_phi.AAC.6
MAMYKTCRQAARKKHEAGCPDPSVGPGPTRPTILAPVGGFLKDSSTLFRSVPDFVPPTMSD